MGRWQSPNWKDLYRMDPWEKVSWRQGSQPEENSTSVSGGAQFNVGSQESPQRSRSKDPPDDILEQDLSSKSFLPFPLLSLFTQQR